MPAPGLNVLLAPLQCLQVLMLAPHQSFWVIISGPCAHTSSEPPASDASSLNQSFQREFDDDPPLFPETKCKLLLRCEVHRGGPKDHPPDHGLVERRPSGYPPELQVLGRTTKPSVQSLSCKEMSSSLSAGTPAPPDIHPAVHWSLSRQGFSSRPSTQPLGTYPPKLRPSFCGPHHLLLERSCLPFFSRSSRIWPWPLRNISTLSCCPCLIACTFVPNLSHLIPILSFCI